MAFIAMPHGHCLDDVVQKAHVIHVGTLTGNEKFVGWLQQGANLSYKV